MKNNYKFLTLISLVLISLGTRSQTLTTILYSDEPGITSAPACNVFEVADRI